MSQVNLLDRRAFLKLTGLSAGGLLLGSSVVGTWSPLAFAQGEQAAGQPLNLFVSIENNGRVRIVCHRSEMGQGVRTSLPQIVADELQADWQQVDVIQGLADERYGSQNTDGSTSIRQFYQTMREMGSAARSLLEQAAAKTWNVPVGQVYANHHHVHLKGSSKRLGFGELADMASTFEAPAKEQLTFKSSGDFKLIGKSVPIVDMQDMVTGNTTFGQDVQLPGMLYASIERAPVVGATVKSFDKQAALKVKGVVDVWQIPNSQPIPVGFNALPGVAVLATNTWAALQGRKQLKIEWALGDNTAHNSDQYLQQLSERLKDKGKVVRQRGDAYGAADQARHTVVAEYSVPYLAHTPMEPPAATAVFKNGQCELWACTQAPQGAQGAVAQALGIDKAKVKVNITLLGGGFGRKSKPDFLVEAALLARHTGKPVKVVWSREDDVRHDYYHAISAQRFQAGLDDQGKVSYLIQRSAFPSINWTFTGAADEPSDFELSLGFGDTPFAVKNLSCESHKASAHLRIGWLRSVCNIQHAFACGAFVDELAVKAGLSTQKMWHRLLGEDRLVDPGKEGFAYGNYGEPLDKFPVDTRRLKAVLDLVVERSGAGSKTARGEGWGISVHRSFVSYVATAIKVRVEDGKLNVLDTHIAIDAGLVVNPDRVRSQLEGAVVFGLSLAMNGEITAKEGVVEQSNFHDYPLLRMHQCPPINTYLVESDAPPGGVGEPGVPPVAASLVNAIYHASGQRIRDLPVNKQLQI